MAIIDTFRGQAADALASSATCAMRLLGWALGLGLYVLLALHVYAYFAVIALVIKKRLGVQFGLVWCAIGLALLYNIIFNHFWAMVIKPGGPADLERVEKYRKEHKQREHRKAVNVNLDDDGDATQAEVEDDRFEGLQKDVKRLMKYRTKTLGELKPIWSKECRSCNNIKPARTHHCSVCNKCVFGMDHHCRK
jgi:hypothetical protein